MLEHHLQLSEPSQALDNAPARSRLFLAAFACDPDTSMEERNGWNRALQAAEDFDVTVACGPHVDSDLLNSRIPQHLIGRLSFHTITAGSLANYCLSKELLFYCGYREWHAKVTKFARSLHAQAPFSVTHMASHCGYREPGFLWQLDCPFMWGPIGGTSNFPMAYISILTPMGAVYEGARNALNTIQLHYCPRVRGAARRSAVVFAANRSTQRDLERTTGTKLELELETGLDCPFGIPKQLTSAQSPLKILWVGRLRPWKGLPLLFHALSQMPESQSYEVRVVGDGASKQEWMRLAKRLKIADRINWIAKPAYRESLHHYEWADLFAFTSLRDTSGTGLLESLAAGVPIVGLNHQGAADIMTDECGVGIPVSTPQESIRALARAFTELAGDRQRLLQLSRGAATRARSFSWTERRPIVREWYARVTSQKVRELSQSDPPTSICHNCEHIEFTSRTI